MTALVKSLVSFSWAMSLLTLRQAGHLLCPGEEGAEDPAGDPISAVTRSIRDRLGPGLRFVFTAGDSLQRGITDVAFSILKWEALTPQGAMPAVLRQSADAYALLPAAARSMVAAQEFQNKLEAFGRFQIAASIAPPPGTTLELQTFLNQAASGGSFAALWAAEGFGHVYAEAIWNREGVPRKLFAKSDAACLPAWSMIPLHAGMGLLFAEKFLCAIDRCQSQTRIRTLLGRFIRLCDENSRQGYAGVPYEALGLVTRILYPRLIVSIDRQLVDMDVTLAAFFWHGVGRGIYFSPENAGLWVSPLWQAVDAAQREPPHELGRQNALDGVAFALTLVNLRHPRILEVFLEAHRDTLAAGGGLSDGVRSAVMVWDDSARDDLLVRMLRQHRPGSDDPTVLYHWRTLIQASCDANPNPYWNIRTPRNSPGELFRYGGASHLAGHVNLSQT